MPTRFRDLLASRSRLPFLLWRARGERGDLGATFKNGQTLFLRGETHDYHTAMELFCWRQYDLPEAVQLEDVRQIVDVGANVGYSLLYFADAYPDAHLTAFEPHPVHVAQIRRHLSANNLSERVTLIEAAAGTRDANAVLSDEGAGSVVREKSGVSSSDNGGLSIPVVDFFAHLPPDSAPIDIVKMDIEGGEYALLADSRFPVVAARTRCIALEWHRCVVMEYGKTATETVTVTEGQAWCVRRLEGLGFRIVSGGVQYGGVAGTFWAIRE